MGSGSYLAPLGLGCGGSVLGQSCVKQPSSLLLLLSIGVEVRGFHPWVLNAAGAESRCELCCVFVIAAAMVLLFFGFGV